MGSEERKRLEKKIKKKDIIDAAEKVFFSKGYENASMDEVAKEAEYSKRTVYIYFNSKEQIYFEIMIRGYRLLIEMMKKTLQEKAPQDAVEELRLIFLTFFQFSVEHKDYFKAIMEYETKEPDEEAGIENEAKDECYRLGEQIFGILVHALQRGVTEGSLRVGLGIEKTALILWACTVGTFITGEKKSRYLMDYHKTKSDDFLSDAFELIIGSIRGAGATLG
ncbi:TetR/AcrR family transcriptional regulator [Caproiciproducens sp. NJN-50]|uniref:TetR/AcrR family transcriptional regulator n=1 Tax=Acutalibacteraceae TaxID=3082771 RepID=UPI000FFE04A1|nr:MULTISPECIES: TetR/AcrR family transcriptional regulator [Acutalibacteraceae]QAT49314.1 TetR/AcrR family transcriptional regulator [Caproiciproducens sp. NJN-50]